jgi:ATP-dependent DNA ligase
MTSVVVPDFQELEGEASTGKAKVWSVEVVPHADGTATITTRHGYRGGAVVAAHRHVTTGKNLGRSNATTALQQAVAEAAALWKKKQDMGGYKVAGGGGSGSGGGGPGAGAAPAAAPPVPPSPMLALDYNDRAHSIVWPAFTQRKLDGVRCVALPGVGLFSRNGKAFPGAVAFGHIQAAVDAAAGLEGSPGPGLAPLALDGELYSDTVSFQVLVGAVKRKVVDPALAAQVHLCVYDCVDAGQPFVGRLGRLRALAARGAFSPTGPLRLLPTEECARPEDVPALHAQYVAEGYEGLMVRNAGGLYAVGHRSFHLQKYKHFAEAEYEVVGAKEGDGSDKGCVIWECVTAGGTVFAVRPRGTREERAAAWAASGEVIGRLPPPRLTVRYQELTDGGVPRFPVGIALRDYE